MLGLDGKPPTIDPEMEYQARNHLARIARFAFLAPEIITTILEGSQPAGLLVRKLLRHKSFRWTGSNNAICSASADSSSLQDMGRRFGAASFCSMFDRKRRHIPSVTKQGARRPGPVSGHIDWPKASLTDERKNGRCKRTEIWSFDGGLGMAVPSSEEWLAR